MITATCWGSLLASSSANRRSSSTPDGLSESGTFTRLIPRIPYFGGLQAAPSPQGGKRAVCAHFDFLAGSTPRSAQKSSPRPASKANIEEPTTQYADGT